VSVLNAISLGKRYQSRQVVDDVSLTVSSGQVVGLLGPNGAGKTTCFYMIVGLIPAEQGSVYLADEDITRFPMHIRARLGIGYLPQEASVFRKLTVAENILAILQAQPGLTNSERENYAEELMQELHITHIRDSLGMSLSGGERRRVEIARALATKPHFILLDEPFAGVDPISVIDIHKIIKHLRERDIGVLITDHNVRETLKICERAYIISEGELIAEGQPAHILANEKVREVYLGHEFEL
jgi:lipopolysaccharide export system ATP-binding protein